MDQFDEFFLRIAMSMDKAWEILGLPPNASKADIDKAYRDLAFKLHPDRNAGDDEKFKELGIAKATIEGEARPSYDHRTSEPESEIRINPKPPVHNTVTFEEAISKAGVPSGVEWLFVTPTQRGSSGWHGNSSSLSDTYFVAYGRTDAKHVFVAVHNHSRTSEWIGGATYDDISTARSNEYPIKAEEGTNPAWLYGNVVRALKDVGFGGRFNSKVTDAKGWKLSDRLPSGSDVSIKHWLVNSGQVAGDAPAVAGRKQVVEFMIAKTIMGDKKPGYYPAPKSTSNFWNGEYHGDYYKFTLIINGKNYELGEDDTAKFLGLKGGLEAMFGTYYYDGSKKMLTRMPKGKKVLTWMAAMFKGLPDDAQAALQAAAEQMKG
jgi:curved DNA-binding protein CbpA